MKSSNLFIHSVNGTSLDDGDKFTIKQILDLISDTTITIYSASTGEYMGCGFMGNTHGAEFIRRYENSLVNKMVVENYVLSFYIDDEAVARAKRYLGKDKNVDTKKSERLTVKSVVDRTESVTIYLYSNHTGKRLGGGWPDEPLSKLDIREHKNFYINRMSVVNYRLDIIIDDEEEE